MLDSVDVKLRLSKATELVDWHLQMRAIKEELGDNDDEDDDVASLERKMQAAGMPPNSVIFVAIANRAQPIPPPLLDKMEVIELPGYTAEEKLKMATRHLIPRVLDQHGLNSEFLKVPEASRVFCLWDCMNSSQANGTSVAVNTCADDSMEVELADKNTLVANKHVLGGSDGSAFGTFGQSRQFGADLPRSQTISITGGFATLASVPASEGGFAAVATGSGGGGFDGVLSGGAPALGGELGVSSLGDEFEETSEELEKKSGDELEEATKEVEIKKETKKGRKKMITVRKSEKKMLPKKETEEPSVEVDLGKVTKKKKRATQNITPVKKPTKDGQPRKKLGKNQMLMVHDDFKRRKENIGILGVKYIKDSMLESIQTSLEAKIKLDEDDIEMKKKKKKNILNASRVLKEKPSQDTVESKTSNVRSEGDIESEKKKSNKRTVSKKESPRKKKMVDLDCTQTQITPTNECESQKNKRKNLDSDEGKQKKSKKGAYSENEISTSTKEISDDITPSLVMAFDKVDNELNSKKEKVKKAQSEIKPGKLTSSLSLSARKKFLRNLSLNDGADENKNMAKENEAVSDDFTPAMKLTNSVDDIVDTHEQEIPDSDEGKQKKTSAQYDITPRMMLEFEKSEKTKDVRNEDISDDITPSLVMAFDKVDNEVNSKKDSKVVANEPVLSFGFSMIASPDKQDDFDKDLNSKKEKVESPHTETKQGENAEVSEKDDDFMMAKDNEVNSKKDSKVVVNEPVLSFGFSMIASPDKQDDFDNDLNSKKEKVESPHTETKQDSDEGKQKETTAKYDITPSLMLEFEKSEKPKDVRNEEISDDITPSLVMAFDKVDNELNSKKESKVIANEPVVSFGFSMISSPEKVKKTHAETKPEDEGNEVDVSKVIEITPFLNVDAEKTFDAENQQRPKRKIVLSDLLRSPYVKRPVQMKVKRTIFEKEMSDFIFSACYCNSDVVFTTATANEIVTRDSIESLCPGVEIHLNVITAWARIQNYQENSKNKESPRRLFCSPVMLV
ncbi:hypothetical protein SSX86_008315 [Deinandra increscens subsp. villosa]|uniref:Uncharacterized protein n=1 Tax=Deinandra increscens subsp. villosa TaxID=3103831 RepID=A0AAP0DF06_9ASTR